MISQTQPKILFALSCFFLDDLINFHGFNAIFILMHLNFVFLTSNLYMYICLLYASLGCLSDISSLICPNRMFFLLHETISPQTFPYSDSRNLSLSLSPPYPYPTTFINFWNPILTTDLPNDFYFPFVLPASFTHSPATAYNLLALQSVYIHQQKDFKNVNWVTSPICIKPFMGLPLHLKETSNCLLWP